MENFQEQLIHTIQCQNKLISDMLLKINHMDNQLNCVDMKMNEMDMKVSFLKNELQATHWNVTHLFGLCNEIKTFLINKMES